MTSSSERPRDNAAPLCARCHTKPQAHFAAGCLCEDCETAIDGMTQAELNSDYLEHVDASG